jgi:hypothetical protein
MHVKTLAVLAAAVNTAQAGTAYIYNYCSFNTYLFPTDATRNTQTPITIAPGGSYSEAYKTMPFGGVSLKLTSSPVLDNSKVTQFEYTVVGGSIWYDISNVNCRGNNCPFVQYGGLVKGSGSACKSAACAANPPNQICSNWYTEFNDDWATLSCDASNDITFYLCAPNGTPPAASTPTSAPIPAAKVAAPAAEQPAVTTTTTQAVKVNMDRVQSLPTTLVVKPRAIHDHQRRHQH